MKRLLSGVVGLALGCCGLSAAASGQVVISQIWGGGGFIGDGPNADCVELFNAGTTPVNLSGLSLQWRVGAGASSITAFTTRFNLSGSIPAKGYFLIQLENPTGTGFALPTPDLSFTTADPISVNRGQLALVSGTTNLGASCPPALNGNTAILDFVGYGRGFTNDNTDCTSINSTFCAQCREGTSTADNSPGGRSSTSAIWIRRKCGGLQDTNVNFADFEQVGPGVGIASPFRNSASAPNNAGVSISPGPTGAAAYPGGSLGLTASVSTGCGAVNSVTVNLTPIGGGASVAMTNNGGGSYSLTANVGGAITPGVKSLVFTATNSVGQNVQSTLDVIVRVGNDDCLGAIALTGPGPFAWSNIGGTTGLDGQVFVGCDNGQNNGGTIQSDVWYTWTATGTGEFTVSTVGTVGTLPGNRYDSRIAIYANACPPGTPLACNDDAPIPDGPWSKTKFSATQGVTYLIQLGCDQASTYTSQGALSFTLGAPGACCFGDAQCTQVVSEAACLDLNGVFRGPTSTCANQICPGFPGACCFYDIITQSTICQISDRFFCEDVNRGIFTLGSTCDATPCVPAVGVCCRGATCSATIDQFLCLQANNSKFVATGLPCNAAGNYTSPCCKADFNKTGGITVQDIFDFLAAWFSNSPLADITNNGAGAPGVQSIFDFLSAWFGGGCS